MERLNLRQAVRLEGEMHARHRAVRLIDPELVRVEKILAFADSLRAAERLEHRAVEPL